jgi:hypothetical protein
MMFGFEQEKPVCGTDFNQGARRNYLPNAIYDGAKLGSQHLLTLYIIWITTFRVAVEKILSVIGFWVEAALSGAAQTTFHAAENLDAAFFPKECMLG